MKYYNNFFVQLKINITTPISRTSTFSCYMIMISCVIISCTKQFVTYSAFITSLRYSFMFYIHEQIFVKMVFYHLFAIFIFFKNCTNKFMDYIFSSVKNNCLADFISKPARNMCVIFFSIWSTVASCEVLLLLLLLLILCETNSKSA